MQMVNFWHQLKRPIFTLAPMFDVTDTAFRQIIAKCGRPDVMFTEFVSVDGLAHLKSQEKLVRHYLQFVDSERPVVAQIFGTKPLYFYEAAKLITRLGFDGIDINMGCPDKKVMKNGGGAALALKPRLAKEIIRATQEATGNLPVSVKTRLGYDANIIDTWIPELLESKPAAITIHARTAKQMSRVPADWSSVARAVQIAKGSGVPILGNGDIKSLAEAKEKIAQTGADGIMIGRGVFENLWLFNPDIDPAQISIKERLMLLLEHTILFEEHFKGVKNFVMLYKHFQNYATGFVGAKELRMELVQTKSAQEVEAAVMRFLTQGR